MNRIRIGKDFKIKWTIWNKETGAAYNLENRNLTLYLNTPRGRIVVRDFSVTGNLIEWNFAGKDQKMVGLYSLVLIENLGDLGMCTIDKVNAFALVAHSHEEQLTSVDNVSIDAIELDGTIGIAPLVALSDWSINEERYGYVKNRTHYEKVIKTITEGGDYEFYDDVLKIVYHGPNGDEEHELKRGSRVELHSDPEAIVWYCYGEDDVLRVVSEDTLWFERYPIDVYMVCKEISERFIPASIARSKSLANVQEQIDNIPIAKGSAENSATLKGGNNKVISEHSVALGKDNFVGLKGWYYKALNINTSTKTIDVYLSKNQTIPKKGIPSNIENDIVCDLKVGDTISLVNDNKWDNKFKVAKEFSSSGFLRISAIDNLPFTDIKTELVLDIEDYSIYCLDKPDIGVVDLGVASFAAGRYNKATNNNATAFGFNNHAYGKFSFAEGRDNEVGYAAHAEGRENVASGEQSHAEGKENVASGNNSHVEGLTTTASAINAHAEGNRTTASGVDSHAEGFTTEASGLRSHAEGSQNKATEHGSHVEGVSNESNGVGSHVEGLYNIGSGRASHTEGENNRANGDRSHAEGSHTVTNNNAEHAEGVYNKSNSNTIHSVGIGSSDTNRKNAHEITKDGKHYIIGIGGYDGTNPSESLDLTTAINNLTAYITTPDDKTSGLMEAIQAGRIIMVKHDEGFFVIASPGPMGEDTNGDPICSLYGIYNNRFYIYNAGVYGISSFTEGDILSDLWFWQEGNIDALKRLCNIPFYPISDEYRDIILGRAVRTEAFISELTGKTWLIDQNDSLYKIVGQGNLMIITQVPETLSYIDEERRAFYVQSISSIFDEQSGYYKVSGVNGFLPAELLYPSDSGGFMDLLFPSTGGHNMVLKIEQELTDEERAQIYKNIGLDSSLSPDSENPVMNKVVTEALKNKATKKEVGSLSNTVASNKTTADASIANLSSKAESLQTQFEILESSVITDSELDDLFND